MRLRILKNNNYRFVLLFAMAYVILYLINYVLTGLIQPGGYYSEWLDHNLDYVTGFRTFLLSSTATITEFFGHDTYLRGNTLFVKGGHNIRMVYSCMGINMLCMWWAFMVALPMKLKKRLVYAVVGTLTLIALNITRLSMLTMSPDNSSFGDLAIDHHTLYNWLVYGVILIVMKRMIDKKASAIN